MLPSISSFHFLQKWRVEIIAVRVLCHCGQAARQPEYSDVHCWLILVILLSEFPDGVTFPNGAIKPERHLCCPLTFPWDSIKKGRQLIQESLMFVHESSFRPTLLGRSREYASKSFFSLFLSATTKPKWVKPVFCEKEIVWLLIQSSGPNLRSSQGWRAPVNSYIRQDPSHSAPVPAIRPESAGQSASHLLTSTYRVPKDHIPCSHLFIEITLTWLPIPFANSSLGLYVCLPVGTRIPALQTWWVTHTAPNTYLMVCWGALTPDITPIWCEYFSRVRVCLRKAFWTGDTGWYSPLVVQGGLDSISANSLSLEEKSAHFS